MEYEKLVAPTIMELFESRIQASILSGDLREGEKLPSEREMAEKMGISKSAVHLGLKNLERSGFIRIEPRKGIYVENWAEKGGLETLAALLKSNVLKLEKKNIKSLIQMREAIEGDAMSILGNNHSEENIQKLLSIAAEIRKGKQVYSADELAELAFRFAHYICFSAGNTFSSLMLNSFKKFALALWREWIEQVGPESAAAYLTEIAHAIESGNGQRAADIEHAYHLDFLDTLK